MFSIINEALLKSGEPVDDAFYLLMDDIDQESCRDVVSWILSNNYAEKTARDS